MLKRIDGFWMEAAGEFAAQDLTLGPFPPGTNVFANISVSSVTNVFTGETSAPFLAAAYVAGWTFYQSDGTESEPVQSMGFIQNAVGIENCARIIFGLQAERILAIAQINVFTF